MAKTTLENSLEVSSKVEDRQNLIHSKPIPRSTFYKPIADSASAACSSNHTTVGGQESWDSNEHL